MIARFRVFLVGIYQDWKRFRREMKIIMDKRFKD